jgi:hypothetical protein
MFPDKKEQPFSAEEEKMILSARKKGLPFPEIADLLPGRTSAQVRSHFQKIDPTRKTNEPWTAKEDAILVAAQKQAGNKWETISKLIPGRSGTDVKNRWYNKEATQKRHMERAGKSVTAENDREVLD